jgi:hypothetical protein
MHKDKSVIPKGDYCYTISRVDMKESKIYTKNCPYYDYTVLCDVLIPTCKYLEKMGTPGCTDEEYKRLLDFYGDHDTLSKAMPLSLLWDSCKECGVNECDCLNS